ncbi:tRNA (guanine(10)-N(2))-dimethyltransferase [Candidatus Bathyarchaeota archaeon]|nr:tRNA (guanine(10)-N(2))-dimethyltransferase [Candidatus Bathyarchaeota archaeon]
MDFIFPSEIITEGKIKALVPRHSAFKKKPSDYAPSKAPVFYNPTMELNRDLAVLALRTHQKILERELYVSEPLTGCGLRGVRLAVEVEGIRKVKLNDINLEAIKMAVYNVELNEVKDLVEVSNEDANLFLSRHAAPRKRFDYVDIDPFGPPVPYIDSSVRSLRNGGLLALTATDMAPLCGVHPKACLRKYGGVPLRTEYCHEQAVRFVAGSLAMVAAKHEIGIDMMFSYSIDHYVRIFAILNHGAKVADKSIQQMGYILHCFSCFHREIVMGITSHLKSICPVCGSKLSIAGPLWLGRISDKNWCSMMEKQMTKRELSQHKKINKILSLVQKEAEAPATYYAVDKICDKFNLRVPPQIKVLDRLKSLGFLAVLTHFNSRGFRTDAPANIIKEVITELATN